MNDFSSMDPLMDSQEEPSCSSKNTFDFRWFTPKPEEIDTQQPENQVEIQELEWFKRNEMFGPPHISDPQYLEYERYNEELNKSNFS